MTRPAPSSAAAAAAVLVLSAASTGVAPPATDARRGPEAAATDTADPSDAEDTRFGGGLYLYTYRPVDLPGVDGKSEIYALYGDVSHREGPWEFRLQARWRETKLRPFYPSTTWVQEAWAALSVPEGAFPAAADADYWLVGVQAAVGILHLRYNFSRADYGSRAEEIHQPGFTVDLTDRIHVLLEYDDWTADDGDAAGGRLDRSLNGVLLIEF